MDRRPGLMDVAALRARSAAWYGRTLDDPPPVFRMACVGTLEIAPTHDLYLPGCGHRWQRQRVRPPVPGLGMAVAHGIVTPAGVWTGTMCPTLAQRTDVHEALEGRGARAVLLHDLRGSAPGPWPAPRPSAARPPHPGAPGAHRPGCHDAAGLVLGGQTP